MTEEELSKLSDQQLLEMAKNMKSSSITYALLIGFLIGIIIYSIAKNSFGFLTLIPLYFIYKMFNGSEDNEALKKILNERNLN